jgi:hypothetical protein
MGLFVLKSQGSDDLRFGFAEPICHDWAKWRGAPAHLMAPENIAGVALCV